MPVHGIHDAPLVMPRTRAGCASIPRPCPFARCRYSLLIDIAPRSGAVRELELPAGSPSCSLDVADSGEAPTHGELGKLLDLEGATVAVIEARALEHFTRAARKTPLADHLDERNR